MLHGREHTTYMTWRCFECFVMFPGMRLQLLLHGMLQRNIQCLSSVTTWPYWPPPRLKNAAGDAAILKQVVDVFQFEAAGFGEKEVHHGYLAAMVNFFFLLFVCSSVQRV